MTSETQSAPSLFIATTTFQTTIHGVEEWITQGQIAEPNSWPVRHWPGAFVPLAIDYPASLERGRATQCRDSVTSSATEAPRWPSSTEAVTLHNRVQCHSTGRRCAPAVARVSGPSAAVLSSGLRCGRSVRTPLEPFGGNEPMTDSQNHTDALIVQRAPRSVEALIKSDAHPPQLDLAIRQLNQLGRAVVSGGGGGEFDECSLPLLSGARSQARSTTTCRTSGRK